MRIISLLFFLSLYLQTWAQQHMQLTLMSHYNDTSIQQIDGDQRWSDVTGWDDTLKQREYLIAGSNDSIFFFDITDPIKMIKCDVEEGHSRAAINRDYDTYSHYLYCVSDRSSPLGSLQIFDLQYLPDSVHKVYDNDTFSINTHTLYIESSSKRLYLCGNTHKPAGNNSMAVLDLSNPVAPVLLGTLDKSFGCSYTHEVFVKHDTAFCSCGYEGLYIVDLHDMNNQHLIASITAPYPQNGYNHSSWTDSTGKFLMFTDENQGLGIKIYNISNIADPSFLTVFNSNAGAMPHNAYWKGGFAYASSYEDGVFIYDVRNIQNFAPNQIPPIAGYYDTYTKNAPGVYNGFHGCWGVWPYLKSGLILASDISEGLFVLKPALNLSAKEMNIDRYEFKVFINASGNLVIQNTAADNEIMSCQLFDMSGRQITSMNFNLKPGVNEHILSTKTLQEGIYFFQATMKDNLMNKKIYLTH